MSGVLGVLLMKHRGSLCLDIFLNVVRRHNLSLDERALFFIGEDEYEGVIELDSLTPTYNKLF